MTKKQTLALIDKAYGALTHLTDSWYCVPERVFDIAEKSERDYRRNRGRVGITVAQAAKLFVVKWFAQGIEKPDRFTIDDVLSIRPDAMMAQAYARKFSTEIQQAWMTAGVRMDDLLALDYADLINLER